MGVKWYKPRVAPNGVDEISMIAEGAGYVMARHKGAMPFVLTAREWKGLPLAPHSPAQRDLASKAGKE